MRKYLLASILAVAAPAAMAATPLSDVQLDAVTAGDFTAMADATALGAVTSTATFASVFSTTLPATISFQGLTLSLGGTGSVMVSESSSSSSSTSP